MAQPTQYSPTTDFSQDEANNLAGRSTVRTAQLDAELAAIALTAQNLITNIGLLQRDDGKLKDSIVEMYALSAGVLALFYAEGSAPRGLWLTATAYAVKDIIETGSPLTPYMCVTAHTSGVFATDYAAGRWVVLGSVVASASNVVFTPAGDIAATNVQSALAELSSEKVAKASNGSDFADIATTRSNLSVFSKAESQTSSYLTALATGTFDAIQAAFTPAITTLTDKQILYVTAIGVNSVTAPTFTPNNGVVAAKPIKKFNGALLDANNIAGAGHVLHLQYSASLDSWLLLNPNFVVFSKTESQTSSYLTSAASGGNDSLQGTFVPAITTLTNRQVLYVTAIGTNVTATPTFTPNNGTVAAKVIKKLDGSSLAIGDIAGSGHVLILQYSASLDAWLLLNPVTTRNTFSYVDIERAIRRARISASILLTV